MPGTHELHASHPEIVKRLKRAEGRLRSIAGMLEAGRLRRHRSAAARRRESGLAGQEDPDPRPHRPLPRAGDGSAHFGATVGFPPGAPGGGMPGVWDTPGATRSGGRATPLLVVPPGVPGRAPGCSGAGIAVCGPRWALPQLAIRLVYPVRLPTFQCFSGAGYPAVKAISLLR